MKPIIIFVFIVALASVTVPCEASWLIYHKPEFKGKIVDSETNTPIENAVVAVVYEKTTIGLGAGANTTDIDLRETKTDKYGNFTIPSYTTLIQPFSWESKAAFIIYKSGYANVDMLNLEDAFTNRVVKIYAEPWLGNFVFKTNMRFIISSGVVYLPKLKKREERLIAFPTIPTEIPDNKMRLLIEMVNDERRELGLSGNVHDK